MPYEADEIMLASLLLACVHAKDAVRTEKAVRKAMDVRRAREAKNEMWYSAIEMNNQILVVVDGDKCLPFWEVTHLLLDQLHMHIKIVVGSKVLIFELKK
ncbi:hypothetical protein SASPL_102748 [Salvia splendens]|uniref:Uncharacterized protein n=1 Tax=Salvia splendens TaxID=180675 RepID=A0A8X9ADK7_SALSN|nr:hypothetical protein SASPL_102748 [Salvia splendens]